MTKFKKGEWICYNQGEYPDHIAVDSFMVTGKTKFGNAAGAINYNASGGVPKPSICCWRDELLRYAHPKEIEIVMNGNTTLKTMKITEEAHNRLKKYCKENFLKMTEWSSHTLIQTIDNMEKENGKTFSKNV